MAGPSTQYKFSLAPGRAVGARSRRRSASGGRRRRWHGRCRASRRSTRARAGREPWAWPGRTRLLGEMTIVTLASSCAAGRRPRAATAHRPTDEAHRIEVREQGGVEVGERARSPPGDGRARSQVGHAPCVLDQLSRIFVLVLVRSHTRRPPRVYLRARSAKQATRRRSASWIGIRAAGVVRKRRMRTAWSARSAAHPCRGGSGPNAFKGPTLRGCMLFTMCKGLVRVAARRASPRSRV